METDHFDHASNADEEVCTFSAPITPPDSLEVLARSQLEHAVDAVRRGLKIYESLRNLNDVIGTQYGDRVLYELLQNAHDAHAMESREGEIAVHLVIRSESDGELRVANRGRGFIFDDLDSIRNIGTSNKEIGESIGNKGLGFRSVEALTDDVHVYSQAAALPASKFDGYCFRFATSAEIAEQLALIPEATGLASRVAATIPRYLIALQPRDQPEEIKNYAREGYATVVVLPLRTVEAVALATRQVRALDSPEAPLMLFLRRLKKIQIKIEQPKSMGKALKRDLERESDVLATISGLSKCVLESVDLGRSGSYLVIRRPIDKAATLEAVKRSISVAPQLARWLKWKGEPEIAIAVSNGRTSIATPRFYNFLAMDASATAPLAGFVDAPFFADIDRRNLKIDLPLNRHFIEQVADTCVGAAQAAIQGAIELPPTSIVDLLAWDARFVAMISAAFVKRGGNLRTSAVWPTFEGSTTQWTSLAQVFDWPDLKFKILTPARVASVGAPILLASLGSARLTRIRALATQHHIPLKPHGAQLANWAGDLAEGLRTSSRVRPRDWTAFYDELARMFTTLGLPLSHLRGKKLILGQSGELFEALAAGIPTAPPVFVRPKARLRRGKPGGPPLPPSSLSRKLRFLAEDIELTESAAQAFRSAGLVRLYDPIDVLANIEDSLGAKATDARRRDALVWAFRVWRAGASGIEDALKGARLRVPVLGGWEVATEASFSASWTSAGRALETYLTEAAPLSPDCESARGRLLTAWTDWPVAPGDHSLADWRRFLERLCVCDGLRPIRIEMKREGTFSWHWQGFFTRGIPSQGFDADWTSQIKNCRPQFSQTNYQLRGDAWRVPGQLEHSNLSVGAKIRLCDLLISYLRESEGKHFELELGIFHRPRDQDITKLPTPLQTFLRNSAWMVVYHGDSPTFRPPGQCWASRAGRQPPRLIDRFSAESNAGLPIVLFDARIGLRDWSDPASAAGRLSALSAALPTLTSSDRRDFRDYYRRAWAEVASNDLALEAESVVVESAGVLKAFPGDPSEPCAIYVTKEPHGFAARALNDHDEPVLDVGDANMSVVLKLLAATGRYNPLQAEDGGVSLRIDDEMFTPSPLDPLLVATPGLDWLPDAVVLAYQCLGDPLELRNVSAQTMERRTRSVRVHRCGTISLKIGARNIAAIGADLIQAFPHSDHPTLIIAGNKVFDWPLLLQAAPALSKLLGSSVKSIELMLWKLNNGRVSDTLSRPNNERLAEALGRGVELVREHFAAIAGGIERQVQAILPVVYYLGGEVLVHALRADAEKAGPRLKLAEWLADHATQPSAEEIIRICAETEDYAQIRQFLSLDFARFNRALIALGLPGLNNRADFERLHEVYLNEMRTELVDRVRRRHFGTYVGQRSLDAYLEDKLLGFAGFNDQWLEEMSILDRETVRSYVVERAEASLGADIVRPMPRLDEVLALNRKVVTKGLVDLALLIEAWRERNVTDQAKLPWFDGNLQTLAGTIEQLGLLDFEFIKADILPPILSRLGLWPNGMPVTNDPRLVGLSELDLKAEREKAIAKRRDDEIAKRSIKFNGDPLDPAGQNFEANLAALAAQGLQDHPDWFARCRVPRLAVQVTEATKNGGGGGTGGKGGAGRSQPPEATRRAMGLASELLAREYLRRRFPAEMTDACWVSTNRAAFCPDWQGDDTRGYDFRVVTARNEWLFEVKSALDAGGEFEFTANELRVAGSAELDRKRRYRILYVPFVFDPARWCVLQLGNPASERTRNRFKVVRTGSVRYSFNQL